MCSYQRANNSYGCQNSKLLNGILKTEMGFEGFVVSDWQAQQSGVSTANAGLDITMPNAGWWGKNLTEAVNNGSVALARLDDMVTRPMAAYYFLNQDDKNTSFASPKIYPATVQHPLFDVRADHGKLIREIGAAGTVLVKNVNKTLPLKAPKYVSIFGYDAEVKSTLDEPITLRRWLRSQFRLGDIQWDFDHWWWIWIEHASLCDQSFQSNSGPRYQGSWDGKMGFLVWKPGP